MLEQEIHLKAITDHIAEMNYQDFDDFLIKEYFDELLVEKDISRLRLDNYYDAGIDYAIMTCNNRQFFEFSDIKELLEGNNNIVKLYIIQTKFSSTITSKVPNNLIEVMQNLISDKDARSYRHYNQEVKDFISLVRQILRSYATRIKIQLSFYYFNTAPKKNLEDALDLIGRFETLVSMMTKFDYCSDAKYFIYGSSDLYKKITSSYNFEYTFDSIDKFEVDLDIISGKPNSIIALIPLQQFYSLITTESNTINEKLFEGNIRDFKGQSYVNKMITETLSQQYEPQSNAQQQKGSKPIKNEFIDFWWLNNGVTITVEELNESKSQRQIRIENPQIVNGLQTAYSIYNHFRDQQELLEKEQRKIFAKIINIPADREDLELKITVATNSQNEIRDKDIRANDEVQKNIEQYFKQHGKYYQRKDKYYTNRRKPKADIVILSELAKYINTIFLRDPSFTRNNPGKLLKNKKYSEIFQPDNPNQKYSRYFKAYEIYNQVQMVYKGKTTIMEEEFVKANFIHHIVYIVICIYFESVKYSQPDILGMDVKLINETLIDNAEQTLVTILQETNISAAKILKRIKEQGFTNDIRSYLISKFNNLHSPS